MPSTFTSSPDVGTAVPASVCHASFDADVSARRSPAQLTLLTVFRFVAAVWVLLLHKQAILGRLFPAPLSHVVSNGAYAMSFFFVLSGAVLAYSYFDLETSPRAAW